MTDWLMCLGAKKCGTTALFNYVRQHPKIKPCKVKEPKFFVCPREYAKGFKYYMSLYSKKSEGQIYFESSVRYFTGGSTPKRVKEHIGDNIKFIVILREPVERLLSQYAFDRYYHNKNFPEFNKMAVKFLDTPDEEKTLLMYNYLFNRSEYIKHFKRWFKQYPQEKFLILDSRDLKRNPNAEANKVFEFAGLKPYTIKNPQPFFMTKYRKEDRIRSEVYSRLREYYQIYNEELYALLGRNFGW